MVQAGNDTAQVHLFKIYHGNTVNYLSDGNKTASRFAMVSYYLLRNYLSRGCHNGGGEALHAVAPKER